MNTTDSLDYTGSFWCKGRFFCQVFIQWTVSVGFCSSSICSYLLRRWV